MINKNGFFSFAADFIEFTGRKFGENDKEALKELGRMTKDVKFVEALGKWFSLSDKSRHVSLSSDFMPNEKAFIIRNK